MTTAYFDLCLLRKSANLVWRNDSQKITWVAEWRDVDRPVLRSSFTLPWLPFIFIMRSALFESYRNLNIIHIIHSDLILHDQRIINGFFQCNWELSKPLSHEHQGYIDTVLIAALTKPQIHPRKSCELNTGFEDRPLKAAYRFIKQQSRKDVRDSIKHDRILKRDSLKHSNRRDRLNDQLLYIPTNEMVLSLISRTEGHV